MMVRSCYSVCTKSEVPILNALFHHEVGRGAFEIHSAPLHSSTLPMTNPASSRNDPCYHSFDNLKQSYGVEVWGSGYCARDMAPLAPSQQESERARFGIGVHTACCDHSARSYRRAHKDPLPDLPSVGWTGP